MSEEFAEVFGVEPYTQVKVSYFTRTEEHGDRYHTRARVTLKPGVVFEDVKEELWKPKDINGLRALPFVESAEVEA